MIPIRDHNPSGSTPYITYIILGINILVFIYMLTLSTFGLEAFVSRFAVIPAHIVQGLYLYTLITSMFLHASFGHIIGNMLFLHIFGDNLEDSLGHIKFLLYYLAAGLAGSLLQVLIDPASTIPNLGASGAIAGIMGGYLLLYPRHRIDVLFSFGLFLRRTSVPAYFMLFYWFIAQFFSGVGSLFLVDPSMGGVAFFAHIGGFLAGFLSLTPFRSRLIRNPSWTSRFTR